MSRRSTLVIAGGVHRRLQSHLLPEDGLEAAAILLCTQMKIEGLKLLVKDVILVPHDECDRASDRLVWPGARLEEAIDRAETEGLSLILMHSHPSGMFEFSAADDASDQQVISAVAAGLYCGAEDDRVHGTAIMVPGGATKARIYDHTMNERSIDLVAVYGDDISFFWASDRKPMRRPLAFSEEMRQELGRLHFALIGVSGTGSIVGQQLARIGVGKITAVDYDIIEFRNLNRILGSTVSDARNKARKVDVFSREVASFSPQTEVNPVPVSVATRDAVLAVADADVIFCCVDSDEGRSVCDRMAEAFLMPLFDVGVVIPVRAARDGSEAILDISGRIDYVQPGGSSLEDREVFTPQSLAAEYLARADREAFSQRVREGYMRGSVEQAPSVITVNMRAASDCVQEFIARAYPYRLDGNHGYARTIFSLAAGEQDSSSEDDLTKSERVCLAVGLEEPLLGLPGLAR